MGKLTNAAKERFDKAQRQHRAPEWLPRASVFLSGVICVLVVVNMLSGDDVDGIPETFTPNNGAVVVPSAPTTSVTQAKSTTTSTTTALTTTTTATTVTPTTGPTTDQPEPTTSATPPDETTVTLDGVDGIPVEVPGGAYNAMVAGIGTLLGPEARIDDVQIRSAEPDRVTFVVTADADGTGPAGSSIVVIETIGSAEGWQAFI